MIYRKWSAYHKAQTAYVDFKKKYEVACEAWEIQRAAFDVQSLHANRLSIVCCVLIITALAAAVVRGFIRTDWGWPLLWLLMMGMHHWLEEKCRQNRKRRFSETNPPPLLNAVEPGFDPLDENAQDEFFDDGDPCDPFSSPPQRDQFCIKSIYQRAVEMFFTTSRYLSLLILLLIPVCFVVSGELGRKHRVAAPVVKPAIQSFEWPVRLPSPFNASMVELPENGLTFQNVPAPPLAQINVQSAPGFSYMLRLDDAITGDLAIMTFVHPGSSLNLSLPYGNYIVKYACGTAWYGHQYLFGLSTRYSKILRLLDVSRNSKNASLKLLLDYEGDAGITATSP